MDEPLSSQNLLIWEGLYFLLTVCMYVCMPFYVVHYYNNLMKAHHYHKSHQISSVSLEKMNIIILVFKRETNKSMQ